MILKLSWIKSLLFATACTIVKICTFLDANTIPTNSPATCQWVSHSLICSFGYLIGQACKGTDTTDTTCWEFFPNVGLTPPPTPLFGNALFKMIFFGWFWEKFFFLGDFRAIQGHFFGVLSFGNWEDPPLPLLGKIPKEYSIFFWRLP